jgi:hypothetical protein
MGSFEWMELQSITGEISTSRTRLSAARAKKDHRLARMLEEEITAAEKRRDELLAHITTHLADVPEVAASENGDRGQDVAAREEKFNEIEGEQPVLELVDRIVGTGAPLPASAPNADGLEGGFIVWDQLTPSDIERAKQELGSRRAEVLARQAEELRALDTDQSQLETLEQAIDAFLRKFNLPSPAAAVVQLGNERESRLQGRA